MKLSFVVKNNLRVALMFCFLFLLENKLAYNYFKK